MRAIAPRIPGAPEVTIAEEQMEYLTIVGAVLESSMGIEMCTRWTFTPQERVAIAGGADLYLRQLTFGAPLQAIAPQVGWPSV